jgi:hypothetical protein
MARPKVYDPEVLAVQLQEYTDSVSEPMIQEFCVLRKINKDTIYRLEKECKALSDSIKYLHAKQELRTIRLAESGDINTTFAIFKLKQKCYGWSDKQEVDQTISNKDDKPFKVEIEVIK